MQGEPPLLRPRNRGLIALFVDRPVTTMMALCAVVLIGSVALLRLPLRFTPEGLTQNQLNVWVPIRAGMSPQEVQDKVLDPLVAMVRTIPGLQHIRSTARASGGSVSLRLEEDMDPSLATAEVRDRLQRAIAQWPPGVDRYWIWKEDGGSAPLAFVQFLTPARDARWDHLMDAVVKLRLESVDGVGRVDIWGMRDETLKIWFDRERLLAHNLDFGAVLRRLEGDNFAEPCGELEVDGGDRSYLLRVDSKFRSTAEIAELPLEPGLRLGDVATIERVPEVRNELSRYNGLYTYTAVVRAAADANPVRASDGLRAAAAELASDPRLLGLETRFLFDQGRFIREGLTNLVQTAVQGGALALVVLWLFLRNLAMTIVIALSIPIAMLVAACHLFFTGGSLDICTMAGLTLAVGMVVDNAVVVLENIRRMREGGRPLREACIGGAREVGLALTMSTLTTVVVFLPMSFMGQQNLRVLMGAVGIPLSVALLASLLTGLWFMPAVLRMIGGAGRLAAAGFGRWSPLSWVLALNHLLLRAALRRRLLGLGAGLALVLSIVPASRMLEFASGDMNPFRGGDLSIHFAFPNGYDLAAAERTFTEFERYAEQRREQWNATGVGGRYSRQGGRIELYLREKLNSVQLAALRARVLAEWPQVPGVRLQLFERQRGDMGGGTRGEETEDRNFVVRLWGRDAEYLMQRAAALQRTLADLPEVESVDVPALERNREVVVAVDRQRAEELGVGPEAILGTMASGLQGRELGRFEESGREVRIVAQFDARTKPGLVELKETRVFSRMGAQQRLAELSTIGVQPTMQDIEAINGRIQCTVVGRRAEGITSRQMSEALAVAMQRFPLAAGYTWSEDSGQQRTQQEIGVLLRAMALSIVLVFLLMGVLFESVILPLSVLATVPCALFGATWSLALLYGRIDPMGMIGMLILCGVVVNNGIVLLDHIVRLRRHGLGRAEAILEGVRVRMRPIFMTAATTFVGLLPMAVFGDENEGISYVGLSIAVAGGLLVGTVTTAVSVPLAYTFADDLLQRLRRLGSRLRGLRPAAAQPPLPDREAAAAPQSL